MFECSVREVFVTGLILAYATAAVAQDNDNRSDPHRKPFYGSVGSTLIYLLTKPGIQQELELDEAASKPLLESLREIDPKHSSFRTLQERQQIRTRSEETKQKSAAAIQKALSEEQFRRFQQLELQYLDGRALRVSETARILALTAQQQEQLKSIDDTFGVAAGPRPANAPRPSDEEVSARFERYKADLLAVLTADQMEQWKTMTGTPFKVSKLISGPSWKLILAPEVQKELGIPEVEARALAESLVAIQREEFAARSRVPVRTERDPFDQNGMRQSQQVIDTVRDSLTISQWNRLQQLILQNEGLESLQQHEVARELGLSQEQRDRVRKIIDEYRRRLFTDGPPLRVQPAELRTRQQAEQAGLLDVLTPDQKTQWESMQGKKLDLPALLRPGIPPAGK